MAYASLNVKDVLSCLKRDCDNAVKWFEINGMQANPSKFQFMVMSNGSVDKECISRSVNESILIPDSRVKVLGVTLDDRLTFAVHISICCSKAARQLNALSRISRYLDISSCSFLFNSFVKSNFNYCPLVWDLCGKVNNEKIEKIQQKALTIIYKIMYLPTMIWCQTHMSPRCLIDDFMEFSVRFSNVLKESIRNVSMICSKSNQRLTRCVTIFVLYNPKGEQPIQV